MCGRYSQTHSLKTVISLFGVTPLNVRHGSDGLDFPPGPRYNIAPSQLAPVIVNVDGTRVLDLYRWGLIPSWAKDMKIGNKMINARCETVGEKPSFRRLVNKRRCLVPADSFYGRNHRIESLKHLCGLR